MMRVAVLRLPMALFALALASCGGTTGGELVTFTAYARGAQGASQPFAVGDSTVVLTKATMHIGAVYVDSAPPTGAETPVCINPGIYVAQVAGPVDVDLLSTAPQEFSVYGNGTADRGLTWEMWLTDGDVNGQVNPTHVIELEGVATNPQGQEVSFGAVVSINDNRLVPQVDPSQPGNNPICKQRILQIGGIDVRPVQGGVLTVTIDPRAWFALGIDFASLPLATSDECLGADPETAVSAADFGTTCIPDTNFGTGAGAQAGQSLFTGIRAAGSAAYTIAFTPGTP
jgi:hypothetical protein